MSKLPLSAMGISTKYIVRFNSMYFESIFYMKILTKFLKEVGAVKGHPTLPSQHVLELKDH